MMRTAWALGATAALISAKRALIVRRDRAGSAPRPTARDLVLLAYAGFVLEPDLDLGARFETCPNGFDFRREVFLNAAAANSFWA